MRSKMSFTKEFMLDMAAALSYTGSRADLEGAHRAPPPLIFFKHDFFITYMYKGA